MHISLRIELPDAPYWMRVYCPVCQQLMRGTLLRSIVREDTGMPAVNFHCVCPDCQIWVKMVISRELAARYPELVGV